MTKDIKISFIDRSFSHRVKTPLVSGDKNVYRLMLNCSRYPDVRELFVYAVRNDGSVIVDHTFIEATELSYTLMENMYSINGEMRLRLVLSDGGDKILTACEMTFDVLEGISGGDAADNSNVSLAEIYLELKRKADKSELDAYAKSEELLEKADKAETLAGYGIQDAYTKGETEALITEGLNEKSAEYDLKLAALAAEKADKSELEYKIDTRFLELVIPKNTVADYPARADDQIDDMGCINYNVYGNSAQKTRSGKNLFNKELCSDAGCDGNGVGGYGEGIGYIRGYFTHNDAYASITKHDRARTIFIPCEPDTCYAISRNTTYNNFYFGYTAQMPAVGVAVYSRQNGVNDTKTSLTLRTGSDAAYLVAYIFVGWGGELENGAWDKIISGIQIEKIEENGAATEYEAYGKLPSPNFPSSVEAVGDYVSTGEYAGKYKLTLCNAGKNLFKFTPATLGGVTLSKGEDGAVILNGTCTESNAFTTSIGVLPKGRYTLCAGISEKPVENDKVFVDVITQDGTMQPFVIHNNNSPETTAAAETATIKDAVCRIHVDKNVVYNNFKLYPQLEVGDAATEYEPCREKVLTDIYLERPLFKIGDYADYIDYKAKKVVRRVREYVCTGNEVWGSVDCEAEKTIRSYFQMGNGSIRTTKELSEKAEWNVSTNAAADKECFTIVGDGKYYVRISRNRCADPVNPTQQDFKNIYTAGTKIYYVPPTETAEEVPGLAELQLGSGTNTVYVLTELDTNGIAVTYYQDINKILARHMGGEEA